MLKKIILGSIIIFNLSICLTFFLIKDIEPVDLYFVHIQIVTILAILIYGYELKFGRFRFLQTISNLIDIPITKATATLWDLKIFYKSPLFLSSLLINIVIVFIKLIVVKDASLLDCFRFILFGLSVLFTFLNLTSLVKGIIGFQAFIIAIYTFILTSQILNFNYYQFEISLPKNINYWIGFVLVNSCLLLLRKPLFKTWVA